MINKKILLRSAVVAAVLAPSVGMASGYKINEQSAAGMGTAHAGRAAMATDASVVYYNPAAMTELDRAQFSGGFTYINADGEFEGSSVNGAQLPSEFEGYDNGGDYLGEAFIPFFYYVQPINDQLSFGLGVFTPFGTNTDYSDNFSGGGFADETSLKSIEIQPSIAFKVDEQLSIGGGVDIVYMEGLLSKQTDLIPYNPFVEGLNDPSYSGFESHFEVEGDDWGYGWNIGAYYKLSDATTFGLTYRSEIELTLEGDSELENNGTLTFYSVDAGTILNSGARTQASKVPLTTPASATLAVTHQLTNELLLQAGTTWTGWSSFKNFDVIATENTASATDPTGGLGDGYADVSDLSGLENGYVGHIDESWTDVWAVSVGATYQLNDRIALRAGYAFDESPVDDEHRTARVPSSDRQWLTAGAQYVVNSDLSFDVAAGYLFMEKMKLNEVNKTLDNEDKDAEGVGVSGEYEIDVFGLAFQVNYKI
ncbi:MAG: outer membrane protein transport protein [Bermanella sp.]